MTDAGADPAAVVGATTVVGAGTMGSGIAQAVATAGHDVTLVDQDAEALDRAGAAVASSLARLVKRGTLDEAGAADARARIRTTTDLAGAVAGAALVIEAVFEDPGVKASVWREIDGAADEGALLATNTSSLSVTELARSVRAPDRFCGLHFFNPVPLLPLVEVVRGERTAQATIDEAVAFTRTIGKTPIVCRDAPGFIVNRLLIPYVNDAAHALAEGVAGAEEIDAAMKLGASMPLGPLALADLIGLDVTLAAIESLHRETGDPRFRPALRLRQLVRSGKLGRKTGEGFHRYE